MTESKSRVVELPGLAPAPLGSYLAALGLLRAVAATYPQARGWWRDAEVFCLLSPLDADGLIDYLTRRWEPTAFVRPWEPDPDQDRKTLGAVPEGWIAFQEALRFSVGC